eukprot:6175493-Pleurochrysis_carterae.AAC.3
MARIEHERTQPPANATGTAAGGDKAATVQVPWEDGAVLKVQTSKRELPEAITQDWRPGERTLTRLNVLAQHSSTAYDMFKNATLPPKLVKAEMTHYNQRLKGRPGAANAPVTEDELMRLKG